MATDYSGWDFGDTASSDRWLSADNSEVRFTVKWQTEEDAPKFNGWDAPDNKG